MANLSAGPRIRERRAALGLTQTDLAERAGISPSYLNLIEKNRRGVAGRVLLALARALDLAPSALTGGPDRELAADLAEIAAGQGADGVTAEEFSGRFPDWARAAAALLRENRRLRGAVEALSDRLAHDPFLGQSVHRLLTNVTAIRSATDILAEGGEMPAPQRARFLAILGQESDRLTEVAQGLAAYFDRAGRDTAAAATPEEALDRFLDSAGHSFADLEPPPAPAAAGGASADPLSGAEDGPAPAPAMTAGPALRAPVLATSGEPPAPASAAAAVRAPGPAADPPAGSVPHAPDRSVAGSATGPGTGTAATETAGRPAGPGPQGRPTDAGAAILRLAEGLPAGAARQLAARHLSRHAADAAALPLPALTEAGPGCGWDPARLAARFGVPLDAMFRRLATLPRDGTGLPPMACLQVTAAGHVEVRRPLPALPLPRHGTACPLWPLYDAFSRPGEPQARTCVLPDDSEWLALAIALPQSTPGFGDPPRYAATMLAVPAVLARKAGMSLPPGPPRPVGPGCRLCPRPGCTARAEPAILA